MSDQFNRFEFSRQRVPETDLDTPLAASRPLFELADSAPAVHNGSNPDDKTRYQYPFANDECSAPYFEQLQARTGQRDYRLATNRVAILVGESALAANLEVIPEETIIMLDISETMCQFMTAYIQGLRQAASIGEWVHAVVSLLQNGQRQSMVNQITKWDIQNYDHALGDEAAFARASAVARQKAIIPWRADIANGRQMQHLGKTLQEHDANVTFMNLTNVLPASESFYSAKSATKTLGQLPVTGFAPILTSSPDARQAYVKNDIAIGIEDTGLGITGPFFGLDNLAEQGGHMLMSWPRGPICRRNLAVETFTIKDAHIPIDASR